MLMAVAGIVGLVVITMSIGLLLGKDILLIEKHNARSEDSKPKYDSKAFGKFFGKIFLAMGILILLIPIAEKFNITWYSSVPFYVICGLTTFSALYANIGNRFRK